MTIHTAPADSKEITENESKKRELDTTKNKIAGDNRDSSEVATKKAKIGSSGDCETDLYREFWRSVVKMRVLWKE